MKAQIMAAPGDPTPMEPRWPGTSLPLSQPLPPGSTVDTIATTVNSNRWNTEKALTYLQTVGKAWTDIEQTAAQVGVTIPQSLNVPAVLGSIAAGLTLTGVSAPVGAILGLLAGLWSLFSGPRTPSHYGNAQVHAWATAYMPQACLDWAIANGRAGWTTTQQAARDVVLYWLEVENFVITPVDVQRLYSNIPNVIYLAEAGSQYVIDLYTNAGIDLEATMNARTANGGLLEPIIQYEAKVNLPPGYEDAQTGGDSGSGTAVAIGAALVGIGTVAYLSSRSN